MPERTTPAQHGDDGVRHIAALNHGDAAAGAALLDLLSLSHTQEAQRLGLQQPPSFVTTLASLQASRAFYLGAWVGETLVGALALGPDEDAGQLAIQTLVVHPDHQRQGHGLALLQAALQRARGLVLGVVVGAANTAAVALYSRQGFVVYRQGRLQLATLATSQGATNQATETGVLMLKMRRRPVA
jgi:ribosomal protein S18 acetylase RimI-like enzyme